MKNSFSINHFPEFHHIETLKFANISSSLDYAETIFLFFKMQYILLHSSSIAQHFSFYRINLFHRVHTTLSSQRVINFYDYFSVKSYGFFMTSAIFNVSRIDVSVMM